MQRKCEASVVVAATPNDVWFVVSDVTRVGEWSGECRGCDWVNGATGPIAGAQFRGRNRRAWLRWSRLNEIVTAEAPNLMVWRTVPRLQYRDSVEWQLRLSESEAGTVVTESFEVLRLAKVMEWLIGIFMPAHRDRREDLREDLKRLKVLVESGTQRESADRPPTA